MPKISPCSTDKIDPVDRGERSVSLDESVDIDDWRLEWTDSSSPVVTLSILLPIAPRTGPGRHRRPVI